MVQTPNPLEEMEAVVFYSFDPFEFATNEIAELAKTGAFDFLDPLSSKGAVKEEFRQMFDQAMRRRYGRDNGDFLRKRFDLGRTSPRLRREIENMKNQCLAELQRRKLTSGNLLYESLAQLFRKAYCEGGLSKLDSVITLLNKKLHEAGCRFGIGPGSATMEGDRGTTEWLAIIFSDMERHEFLCINWCRINNDDVIPLI